MKRRKAHGKARWSGWVWVGVWLVSGGGVGCGGEPVSQTPASKGRKVPLPSTRWESLPQALTVYPVRSAIQRGFCLSHSHQGGGAKGYGTPASRESKEALQKLGVGWVSLTRFGWMESLTSRKVEMSRHRSQSAEDTLLRKEIQQAHEMGLKMVLKPHIWIRNSQWIGDIQPGGGAGWTDWFQSYTAFVLHYARLAQELKVEVLVLGVEMKSATGGRRDDWIRMIQAIREVYSGTLTYGSNWDETRQVVFWDQLDAIGVQFYGPLTDQEKPTYAQLLEGVKKYLATYEAIAKAHNKPILFTEVGYRSTVASYLRPHVWPQHLPAEQRAYDELSQALGYAAFLRVMGQSPHVEGIYWWKWFSDVHTDEEGEIGFSPYGKLATQVLKAAFLPAPSSPK